MNRRGIFSLPIIFLILNLSCGTQEPKETSSDLITTTDPTYLVAEGDIVAVSYTNDTLVVFDSSGNLKRTLYTLPLASDNIRGHDLDEFNQRNPYFGGWNSG